jgi:hypothetical protein
MLNRAVKNIIDNFTIQDGGCVSSYDEDGVETSEGVSESLLAILKELKDLARE